VISTGASVAAGAGRAAGERFARVDTVHDAGGPAANEDWLHVGDGVAWVLDGATGLAGERLFGEGASDAELFARLVSDELQASLAPERSLAAGVETALAAVARRLFPAGPPDDRILLPTAAIALLRWRPERLELYLLGDCQALVGAGDRLLLSLADDRPRRFDAAAIRALQERLAAGESFAAARAAVDGLLVEHRRLANTPDGYWILGADPRAARHGLSLALDNPPPAPRLLLMTDGFAALLEYGGGGPQELLREAAAGGLAPALRRLRETERADPETRRHPRLKPGDDATAVYLEVP